MVYLSPGLFYRAQFPEMRDNYPPEDLAIARPLWIQTNSSMKMSYLDSGLFYRVQFLVMKDHGPPRELAIASSLWIPPLYLANY